MFYHIILLAPGLEGWNKVHSHSTCSSQWRIDNLTVGSNETTAGSGAILWKSEPGPHEQRRLEKSGIPNPGIGINEFHGITELPKPSD